MISRILVAGVVLAGFATPVLASDAGRLACETDLKRFSDLYAQTSTSLTPDEQRKAQDLMQVGKSKCEADGANALNTKSPEAMALIEKMEKAAQQAKTPGSTKY